VTVLLTGLLLLIGGYLQSTIQAEFGVNPLPSWLWTLILIVVIAAILYFGVRVSTRSQLVLALVSILVVTIFFISVMVKLGSANSLKPFNPSSAADGWSGIFFGMLYGVLLFVGFETAANLAEETPKPRREIPIAVIGILITAAAIFGSFYKVTSPTIWAPWLALALLVVGFASTFVLRARQAASSQLADLSQGTRV
jgi:amino acid transporter